MFINSQNIVGLLPILGKIFEFIKEDNNHYYGLIEPIIIRNIDCSKFFKPFNYSDNIISISKVENSNKINIVINPFPAESKLFNGTSFLPDKGNKYFDITFLCACIHDVLYDRLEILAEYTNINEKKLRKFADVLLGNLIYYAGGKTKGFKIWSKIVYTFTRIGGGIYHMVNKILIFLILTSLISGCSFPMIIEELPEKPIIDTENVYLDE